MRVTVPIIVVWHEADSAGEENIFTFDPGTPEIDQYRHVWDEMTMDGTSVSAKSIDTLEKLKKELGRIDYQLRRDDRQIKIGQPLR